MERSRPATLLASGTRLEERLRRQREASEQGEIFHAQGSRLAAQDDRHRLRRDPYGRRWY